MAFDPNLPADHSPLSSAEMRSQLQNLKALIDQKTTPSDVEQSIATNSAKNVDELQPFYIQISDPPTQGEVQSIVDKLSELLTALQH